MTQNSIQNCIVNFFANLYVSYSAVLNTNLLDHNGIIMELFEKLNHSFTQYIYIRIFNDSELIFQHLLEKERWDSLDHTEDSLSCFQNFISTLVLIFNLAFPCSNNWWLIKGLQISFNRLKYLERLSKFVTDFNFIYYFLKYC